MTSGKGLEGQRLIESAVLDLIMPQQLQMLLLMVLTQDKMIITKEYATPGIHQTSPIPKE